MTENCDCDCDCGCNCECHGERYTMSNDYYIADNVNHKHLSLRDACDVLNDKDRVIHELFQALIKCGGEK